MFGQQITTSGGFVNIPPFLFTQMGLLVNVDTLTQLVAPSLAAPYYVVVTAPTSVNINDLVFTFAKTPRDLTASDVIIGAWDGAEWRLPQILDIDGVYKDIDQANIDFGKVGPYSGLDTVVSGPNYVNSPGVVVDTQGLRQGLDASVAFPIVATDPDFPRVDRIVYRRPADSPDRIGTREFTVGGTYATTPQYGADVSLFTNTAVRSTTKLLVGSDNSIHSFAVTGYGGAYHIAYSKLASDRTTFLVTDISLATCTETDFAVAIDNADHIHLAFVNSSNIYYQKFSSVGASLFAAKRIDTQSTPSTGPAVAIDPASTKVFFTYQSLLGAFNNQIFFTSTTLGGSLITPPMNLTNTLTNLQNPDVFVSDDLVMYVAWEDTTAHRIYFQSFDDVGNALAIPTEVSGSVQRISPSSVLVDGATDPRIRVADNKSVFVTFRQNKGSNVYGLSIWNDGTAFMQTMLTTGENFISYDVVIDPSFNGVHLFLNQTTSSDYVKLLGEAVEFTLNVNGQMASVATVFDKLGSMYHAFTVPLPGTYTSYQAGVPVQYIGPATVIAGLNTYVMTAGQLMLPHTFFTGEQPAIGDRVTVTDTVNTSNSGNYIISGVQLVQLVTPNDTYIITMSTTFTVPEPPPGGSTASATFASPDPNSVTGVKSTSEIAAFAFTQTALSTDVLLTRISMPGSIILTYLPPGQLVALDSNLFLPHGNNVNIDWEKTTAGHLTIAGGLQILDMLGNVNYSVVDGSYSMGEGDTLYVRMDGTNLTPTPGVTLMQNLAWSTPVLPLGVVKEGSFNPSLLANAGMSQLVTGEGDIIGEDLPLTIRARLGITSDTTYEAYSSTILIGANQTYPEAISALDSNLGALVTNNPTEDNFTGDGTTNNPIFALVNIPSLSTNNAFADAVLTVDGRKQPLDGTGTTGWRKISTTQVQLSGIVDAGALINIRKEGVSYGGPIPPAPGKLWSDPVDHNIVGPGNAFSVGSSLNPFANGYFTNAVVGQLSLTTGIGLCSLLKLKMAGTNITAGEIVSLYSDGKVYPGAAAAMTGRREIGIAVQAISSGSYGLILLFGPTTPGVLTSLGFTPGEEVFISDTGSYTNGSTGISGSGDTIARVGWADCAPGIVSGTATDLILNYQKIGET
jgi:hypothetical protein